MDALQTAKLEALAQFAGGAAHEINNPAAAIWGRVQLLLSDETDPQRRRTLATIGVQALRIRDMIGDLMLFARPPVPQPRSLDLSEVLAAVLPRFADQFQEKGLRLLGDRRTDVTVWADRTQLCVVISELMRNALRFSPAGGSVWVSAHNEKEPPRAVLTVRDEGPGLNDEEREHLFDPFYCERQADRGLGFGLPKCWRIVTQHGGTIDAVCPEPHGVEVVVRWPTAADVV